MNATSDVVTSRKRRSPGLRLAKTTRADPPGIGHILIGLADGDERFRDIIEALPAAIYITNAEGRITFYNDAAAALWARKPKLGEDQWCGFWKLYWPDGRPLAHAECPMAVALKTGRPLRGVEAVAERYDGSRIPFAAHPIPIFAASGELLGGVNMLVDLSDRKRSEESALWLAAIVESSDDAIVSKDLCGIISSWNTGAEHLFGYTAEEAVGKSILIIIPTDRASEEQSILASLRRGQRIDHFETVRRRKDGQLIDVSLTVSPIRDANGRVIGASKIARDITERKRAQEQQRLLLGEIMHRVKNTLATVQAMATRTLRRAPVEERDAFTARLHALSKAHDLLTSDTWDRAPLRGVITAALVPFERERFEVSGPDLMLNASKSLHMTLALHELATNAAKYGALSKGTGQVRLSWWVEGGTCLKVCWRETGGPVVSQPTHKGFGSLLIEHTFDAVRFAYSPQGLCCEFELPVA